VKALRTRLSESASAVSAVFRNPDLRRLELAWGGSVVGQWAYGVGLAVFAFRAGGAGGLGLVWLIRMIPSALVAPFAGVLADRYRRERIMVGSDLVRAALLAGGAAAIALDVSVGVIYALAALVSVSSTPFRSAEAALTPALAKTPEELTAANLTASSLESVGFFAGPALAGILLSVTGPAPVFAATAGTFLWSALLISRITSPARVAREEAGTRPAVVSEVLAGFRAIASDDRLRMVIGFLVAATLVVGAFEVLLVASALDLLHIGKSGVGFLNSAYGVGTMIGTLAGLTLVGARRLSIPLLVGIVLFGGSLALVGTVPSEAVALVLFAIAGVGSTLFSLGGFTLVQRVVADEVMARVFGVIQLLWLASVGIGAVLTSPLIDALGLRGALIATGVALPALVAVLGPRLLRIDSAATAPAEEVGLLRAIPIFAPLPGVTLEHVAARLIPLRVEPGTEIIREGDAGDRFYLVVQGEVDVLVEGRKASSLGPGGYFGEIALLRDVPRTATVIARTPVTLYALERDDFLAAVTSHPPSARAADAVVGQRLTQAQPSPQALPTGEPA
jgi:MFS family permease